jgi:hypothetical protein
MMILLALAGFAFASNSAVPEDCPMRPPPLDLKNIQSHSEVKSYVMDVNGKGATILLKDGSVLRILNMGCQHSGASAQLWIPLDAPATSDIKSWTVKAKLAADIGFTPNEAKPFDAWLSTAKLTTHSDNTLAGDGTGLGDLSYSVAVSAYGGTTGTFLEITYAYP